MARQRAAIAGVVQMPKNWLAWCVIVSTVANVVVACAALYLLLERPYIRVSGYVTVDGSVYVERVYQPVKIER